MSTLRDRIGTVGSVNPDLVVVGKNYGDIKSIPLVRIQVDNMGTLYYEDLQPLITADGAPVASTGPGSWGQLYAAGRR